MTYLGAPESQSESISTEWWLEAEGDVHKTLLPVVERIRRQQDDRTELALHHARLWGDSDLQGLTGYEFARRTTRVAVSSQNVTRNMVSAVTSRITKNRPKPVFLPNGGDYQTQIKAKKLEKGVDGCFYQGKLYEKAPVAYRDCLIFGTGFIKVYPDLKRGMVGYDRCFEWDVLVDDEEAIHGEPRSKHYQKSIDKKVLIANFANGRPDLKRAIEKAPPARSAALAIPFTVSDNRILVTESWHLPSGPDEDDGLHVICIDGADLLVEEWTYPKFPIIPVYWQKPLMGYYGDGLVYELAPLQIQINKTLRDIHQAHDLNGKGYWLVQNGSDIATGKLSNNAGTVVRYTGVPPQFYAPQLISPEIYPFLGDRVRAAYETSGISQLAASAQKPAGLNSGEAIRAYADEQSERFVDAGRIYENWFLEIADVTIETCRTLAKAPKDSKRKKFFLQGRGRGRDAIQEIPWADVDMAADAFSIKVFPASMLPQTPAGRLAFVNDMMRLGMDPEDAFELVDISDIEEYTNLRLSARRIIDKNLETMIETGVAISPEPFDNAAYGLAKGRQRLHRAKEEGVPEDRQKLIRTWCVECWRLANQKDPMASAFGDAALPEGAPQQGEPPMPGALPPGMEGGAPMLPGGPPPMPPPGLPAGAPPAM